MKKKPATPPASHQRKARARPQPRQEAAPPRPKTARSSKKNLAPLASPQLAEAPRYVLRLFVAGSTPRSASAIANIQKLCERHLKGRYDLEVVDIYQQPILAQGAQIIAAPTLIKKLPVPLRKFVGDLSNEQSLLIGLDLHPAPSEK